MRSRSSRVASGLDPSIGVFRSQEEAKQRNHRAADVRRFAYLINTNEIFGTHTDPARDPARGPHHICARPQRTSSLLLQNLIFGTDSGILRFKLDLRLEERGNHVQQEGYQRDHSR